MLLERDGRPVFPVGFYELPRDENEWKTWSEAGVNLVCCHNREQLDKAQQYGMFAWVPVPMVVSSDEDEQKLRDKVTELCDHPAVAIWEAPDEAIWWTLAFGNERAKWLWKEPQERVDEVLKRRDDLVRNLARGSAIIRELDPTRKLWLNEAAGSDLDTLARVLPYLDAVGFDFYPVPTNEGKPISSWGPMLDRFVRVAPKHEMLAVHQWFSWSSLPQAAEVEPAYPTLEETRFMAWQTIMHGATGILWWGSRFEDRPAPFLDDILTAAGELNQAQPFLTRGLMHTVTIDIEERTWPRILGVSGGAYRTEEGTMLVLVCEDGRGHEVFLRGFDLDPNEMKQITPESSPFVRTRDAWATLMDGYEVRIYVSERQGG